MIYEFKVIKKFKVKISETEFDEFEEGTIVEMDIKPSQYDAFKAANGDLLERYFSQPIPFTHGREARLDGIGGERMKRINENPALGNKKMFSNSEFQPWRHW